MEPVDIRFFTSSAELRAWLEEHHDTAAELWIGFYRKSSGLPTITPAEAVDEALCFGWIDGIRKKVDDISYTNRYTPRRAGSNWSAVNVKRVGELTELGRMREAGLKVFQNRDRQKEQQYSYEQSRHGLSAEYETEFQKNTQAWSFFRSQPPSYRKTSAWWVMSAKREETRRRRLATLIGDSEAGQRIALLRRKPVSE